MKKLILLLIILFTFISCSPFYFPDNSVDEVTKKTTINDIGNCTDPIVITMPVYKDYNLFGNENMGTKLKQIGDIFVVIDTETNKLYDWVYEPNEDGSVIWRCVELGKGKEKKYFASSINGIQSYIQAGNSKVQRYKTDASKTYMDSYNSVGTKGLLIGFFQNYEITVFDSNSGSVKRIDDIPTTDMGAIRHPLADENGDYYIACEKDDYTYIYKIDTKNNSVSTYDKKFLSFKDDTLTCSVLGIQDKKIIIDIDSNWSNEYESYIYAFDISGDKLINERKYVFPQSIIDKHGLKLYSYTGVFYGGKFYVIVPISLEYKFYILEIDPNGSGGEAKLFLEEPVDFDMTETVWLRDSKLYFMDSRRVSDIKYMYIDLETKEQSEIFKLTYDEVIKS